MSPSTPSGHGNPGDRRPLAAQVLGLVVLLAACYAAAYLGSLATTPNITTWYAGLNKPWFNPPNAIFPIVWSVLYALMAVAAWLVWRDPPSRLRTFGLVAFAVQLALNVGWSWAFFDAQDPIRGLAVIVLLLAAITWTGVFFWQTNRLAAWLMLPYYVWVIFATILNIAIVALN